MAVAYAADTPGEHAVADMTALAFFFLLRPGEYTGTGYTAFPSRRCAALDWTVPLSSTYNWPC